jgi:hypothetical protein
MNGQGLLPPFLFWGVRRTPRPPEWLAYTER